MNDHHDLDADQYMDPNAPPVKDRFIGAILGMGIGDALAMPVRGMSRAEIRDAYGRVETYLPLRDEAGDMQVPAGQFTDNTELALCLAESLVSGTGFLDPVTAGYRFEQVLSSDYNHFLDPTTRAALERARDTGDYQAGLGGDGPPGAEPAARIVPIALVHALSTFNAEVFVREVLRSTLITHAHPESVNAATAMAYATRLVVRREVPPELVIGEVLSFIDEDRVAKRLRIAQRLLDTGADTEAALDELGTSNDAGEAVPAALYLFTRFPDDFETPVLEAVNAGGAADVIASMVGALSGAWFGAQRLPEPLIEGLDGRMYILMAAPTILRTAQLRAGFFLQLHER